VPAILQFVQIRNPESDDNGSLLLGLTNPATQLKSSVALFEGNAVIGVEFPIVGINSIPYVSGVMYQLCGIFSVRISPAYHRLNADDVLPVFRDYYPLS
jgi:hypothetical protein